MLLIGLVAPSLAVAAFGGSAGSAENRTRALGTQHSGDQHDDWDGACSEEEQLEELIDCGSDLDARIDEPLAIAVLRNTEVRTTRTQCEELLADIWDRQTCSADYGECGTVTPGGMPGPAPKLASSSGSGHAALVKLGLGADAARRLGPPADERMPKLRDLLPPVPPPKLAVH